MQSALSSPSGAASCTRAVSLAGSWAQGEGKKGYQKGLGWLKAGERDGRIRSCDEQATRRTPRAAMCCPKRQRRSMRAFAMSPARRGPPSHEGSRGGASVGTDGPSTLHRLVRRCRISSRKVASAAAFWPPSDLEARRSSLSCTYEASNFGKSTSRNHHGR